jgi:hypothetical protein
MFLPQNTYLKPVQIKTACLPPEKVVLSGVQRLVAALHTVRLIYAQASLISLKPYSSSRRKVIRIRIRFAFCKGGRGVAWITDVISAPNMSSIHRLANRLFV